MSGIDVAIACLLGARYFMGCGLGDHSVRQIVANLICLSILAVSPSESLQSFFGCIWLGLTPHLWTLQRCSSREPFESLGSMGRYIEALKKLSVLNLPCWEFSIFDMGQRLRGRKHSG